MSMSSSQPPEEEKIVAFSLGSSDDDQRVHDLLQAMVSLKQDEMVKRKERDRQRHSVAMKKEMLKKKHSMFDFFKREGSWMEHRGTRPGRTIPVVARIPPKTLQRESSRLEKAHDEEERLERKSLEQRSAARLELRSSIYQLLSSQTDRIYLSGVRIPETSRFFPPLLLQLGLCFSFHFLLMGCVFVAFVDQF
jgi:hypothetical protein